MASPSRTAEESHRLETNGHRLDHHIAPSTTRTNLTSGGASRSIPSPSRSSLLPNGATEAASGGNRRRSTDNVTRVETDPVSLSTTGTSLPSPDLIRSSRTSATNAEESLSDELPEPKLENTYPEFDYEPIGYSVAQAAGFKRLKFRPWALKNWFLSLTMLFFLACIASIAGILFLWRRDITRFHLETTQSHLAFQYVPTIIGTVTTIWWRVVYQTFYRLNPYLCFAAQDKDEVIGGSDGGKNHWALGISSFTNSFEPASFISNDNWLLFLYLLVVLATNLTMTPLKAAFIQTAADEKGWQVNVLPNVGFALIALYVSLLVATLFLMIIMWDRETGLRWDPVSLADQLALVQGSNIFSMFQGLEFSSYPDRKRLLGIRGSAYGKLRLGYWRHRQNGSIWHGLACIKPLSTDVPETLERNIAIAVERDKVENPRDRTLQELPLSANLVPIPDPERYRYREANFLVGDAPLGILLSGLVIMISLNIAGLGKGRIQDGFDSSFAIWTWNTWESRITQSFLYRFLPMVFMSLFSMLLPPGIITFKALTQKHFRVALFSFLSLVSNIPMIITAGLFVSHPTPEGVAISIQPRNYWAIFSFLIIYLICLVVARPAPKYRLPVYVSLIGHVLTLCYASRILDDQGPDEQPIFSARASDEERIHLESRIHLAKQKYKFGLYLGRDGKRHLGFDVDHRQIADGRQIQVQSINPGRALYPFGRLVWWWRTPSIVEDDV
ncbi:hypothetical protein B0J14DRAFT_603536 [Halenospora varia]|nr:hypothetical protein B0J14DRAFT_603536 [Halenospora varia]